MTRGSRTSPSSARPPLRTVSRASLARPRTRRRARRLTSWSPPAKQEAIRFSERAPQGALSPFKPWQVTADRDRMASQLRLHVLLPLAFLGLVGAAFGVYTMGKAPGGGNDAGVPLVTTHPDKSKPKPDPKAATVAWVKSLETWCSGLEAGYAKIAEPTTIADFESAIGEYVELWDSAQPAFIKLGLPQQKKQTALALRRNIDATAGKL